MKRPEKSSIKGPLALSLFFHLALIAFFIIGYPIINQKKPINIQYNVKLFEPKPSKTITSENKSENKINNKKIQKAQLKKEKPPTKKTKKVVKKLAKNIHNKKEKKVSLNPSKKEKKRKKKQKEKTAIKKQKKKKENEEIKLKKKLQEIQKKIREKQEEEYLKKRLAALQKGVKHKPSNSSSSTGKGKGSKNTNNALKQYAGLIWMKVRRNWHFPNYLLKNRQLEAIITITINKDGKILNKRFEKRSGFPAFDRSVLKAIADSDPLPPLPKALGNGPIEIGIRFNPSRMNL